MSFITDDTELEAARSTVVDYVIADRTDDDNRIVRLIAHMDQYMASKLANGLLFDSYGNEVRVH